MNRLALMTGILSLTLVGVAAQAQTQSSETQPGAQPKFYQNQPQPQSDTLPGITYSVTQPPATDSGSQPKLYQHQAQPTAETPPGSTYAATQQRDMNQPGSQPKLYQYQAQASGPAPVSNGSTTATSSSDSAQKSAGFFSGWFQRMDDESSAQNREVQPGYQPKFYREQTTSQESQGPGITYSYEQGRVAQTPGAIPPPGTYAATQPQLLSPQLSPPGAQASSDPTALNRINPAAGTPAGAPVGAAPSNGGTASGAPLMTEMQKCEQLTDMTGRADCELQAHKKAGQSVELNRPSIQVDEAYDRNNNGGGAGAE